MVLFFFCSSEIRKDKARGSFSQFHTRKEILADDADTEKQEESLLTECKRYLGSILVHWEPVFPLSEAQPDETRDKLDPSQLAGDTAHLLTKWCLRCLVEGSYDGKRTNEFLHWVQKAVMEHSEMVTAVLLDSDMKADFLRLYNQAFEAQCSFSLSARAETLQLFTTIMIRFLEAQGELPEQHQTVVSACLPEDTPDPSRRGKKHTHTHTLSMAASVHITRYHINTVQIQCQTSNKVKHF